MTPLHIPRWAWAMVVIFGAAVGGVIGIGVWQQTGNMLLALAMIPAVVAFGVAGALSGARG